MRGYLGFGAAKLVLDFSVEIAKNFQIVWTREMSLKSQQAFEN